MSDTPEDKTLKEENDRLKKELEMTKIMMSELEQTNSNLISATWRERDLKKKLVATLDELNTTKVIVEAQNKRIAESINYARKIQLAINPKENLIKAELKDSFILFKPKDVISGDFPWFCKKEDYIYIAAADCTGHGVPGAMMSMVGNLLLNDIANDTQIYTPADVLNKLHNAVVYTLKQDNQESNSNDGMDIAICRINLKNNELLFSGAHRPLFHLRKGELTPYGGDKFPIGGVQYKGKNFFTDHTVTMQSDDSIFIFSDGFPDQIGGPDRKKFMTSQIKEIIIANEGKNMDEMKSVMENSFNNWVGDNKQVDDVLMIGVKF